MDTGTSQKWSKRKGAKTSHPKVPKPLVSHMFSFSIIQGRGGRRWRSIAAISIYPPLVLRKSGNPIKSERFLPLFWGGSRKTKGGDMELAARPGGSSIIQGSQNEPRNEPKFGPNVIAHVAFKRLPPRSQETFRSFCHLCGKRCTGKPLYNIPSRLPNPSCLGLTRNAFLGMF